MKGKAIYITKKEYDAINEATDTLAGLLHGTDNEEFIISTEKTIHELYNVLDKFNGIKKRL